jgi:hypothetical protein
MANALTGSLAADGQTTATGNLQMGNNKIVDLDDGTAAGDAVNYGQLLSVAGGTGRIVQRVQTNSGTQSSNSGSSYSATGFTASITPTSSTSKILILLYAPLWQTSGYGGNAILTLYRNGASFISSGTDIIVLSAPGQNMYGSVSFNYLDSPATTSAVTYQPYIKADTGGQCFFNGTGAAVLTLLEVTA